MTWRIVGHDWAVTLLRQGLAADQVAHAYLFCGPPQVGKTTLALALAQALNCDQPDPPCGQCPSCRKIAQRAHPDVQLVVGQGAGESIRIDQVRALQREAVLAPYEGRYRVFVLRRIDGATTEAANSLLKTLEEPPAHVVLSLTAEHTQTIPPTVVSRCQRLDLRPVPAPVIETALLEKGLSLPQASLLARLSGGRIGWALRAAAEDDLLRQREQDLDQLRELMSASRVERFEFAERASRDVAACRRQIEYWASWWRDLLLLSTLGDDHIVNMDRLDELRLLAESSTSSQAHAALSALQRTTAQLEANVNARLALENLRLKLPRQLGAETRVSQRGP